MNAENREPTVKQIKSGDEPASKNAENGNRADLIALFRLLLREPPPDHDFKTCPICKRYGITHI